MQIATPFGNPFGYLGATKAPVKDPKVTQLQLNLSLFGLNVGDSKHLNLKNTGVADPATVAAVNRAFTTHIGAGQAPAQFRTGKLTAAQVKANAATLASLVAAEFKRRGSTVTRPAAPATATKIVKGPGGVLKKITTQVAAKTAPPVVAVKVGKSPDVQRLQKALKALGTARKDKTLSAIVADGLIGPKTVAAANRGLQLYATTAPNTVRSGKLSLGDVAAQAATLASYIETARTTKTPAASRGAVAKVSKKTKPATKSAAVKNLQRQVNRLAQIVGDKSLMVTADGLIGPKTTAAANKVLNKYVKEGTPAYRTGALSQAQVRDKAATLAGMIGSEIKRRGQAPAPIPPEEQVEVAEEEVEEQGAGESFEPTTTPAARVAATKPRPAPAPSSVPGGEADEGGGGGYSPGSEAAAAPGSEAATSPGNDTGPAPFPTKLVVGGAAGLLLLGGIVYMARRRPSQPQRRLTRSYGT